MLLWLLNLGFGAGGMGHSRMIAMRIIAASTFPKLALAQDTTVSFGPVIARSSLAGDDVSAASRVSGSRIETGGLNAPQIVEV
jgi:hypothetical protein